MIKKLFAYKCPPLDKKGSSKLEKRLKQFARANDLQVWRLTKHRRRDSLVPLLKQFSKEAYYAGFTQGEIAKVLNRDRSTINNYINR